MRLQILFFLCMCSALTAQDPYHTSILENLNTLYGLEGGLFLFGETEQELVSNSYEYGNIEVTDVSISDRDFALSKHINVVTPGNNAWDAGMGTCSQRSISQDDLILLSFWAKHESVSSQIFVFAEESSSFEKEFYFPLILTPDWTQYFVVFKATKNFNIGELKAGFHLATMTQEIDIAGLTALNYEDAYDINDLPSSFSPFDYEGSDPDAPWRAIADARIENIRKSDLTVSVVDNDGNPINNAIVEIEMLQHDFGFGSALVMCRFPGNNCYDATYVEKMLDLDGEGHGFNACVNENALKWRGWENNWLGTKEEVVDGFEWLTDQGITMRGHNLFWPGSDFLPDDMNNNLDDLDYLRNRIDARIEEMINHPRLSNYVRDWDILNEITTNRTLENAFDSDPNFENGRELYNEIYNKVREADPELELYINDYMAISNGSANLVERYKSFLDELLADGVPFDGIGFQAHIGSVPNSIPRVEQIYDEFFQRYGKRMKVTEYDINAAVDEQTAANYMRDFLTLTFSHPGMDAFIMWGFWDGNHWKQNAPMFNLDWSLKPSGEAFIQKVFNEWWTEETRNSNAMGLAEFRPFKGKHKITVTKNGEVETVEIDLIDDGDVTVVMSGASALIGPSSTAFRIYPNPVGEDYIKIDFPANLNKVSLEFFDVNGRQVKSIRDIESNARVSLGLPTGVYEVKITSTDGVIVKKLIVH